MLTTNAWFLGLLFTGFVIAIVIGLITSAMYFGNPPQLYYYPYWLGLVIMSGLIISFVVGSIKFLHGLYGIDAYNEDIYFRRMG